MKIIDLLKQNKPMLSFEVFPPKTSSTYDSVFEATQAIAQLKPPFISVTYGAAGGAKFYSLDIAKNLLNAGVTPAGAFNLHFFHSGAGSSKAGGIKGSGYRKYNGA